ncbi:hypothetical protein OOU_Y34scaffold01165g13 [Pyricularia oryzae Y34]|uniref:Uncharacterized protein n=2 Tax=Pyricularia oryzae TaxID=318829 RepID=A0AA97NLN9_PYRO3|nr:hypothetical protein OOU_Y34scaffold01165g13 [Pyricularia oryzae Y34]
MRPISCALMASLLHTVVPAPTPEPMPEPMWVGPVELTPSICISLVALGVTCTNMIHNLGKAQRKVRDIRDSTAQAGRYSSGPPLLPYKGKLVAAYEQHCDELMRLNEQAKSELNRLQGHSSPRGSHDAELGRPSSSDYLTPQTSLSSNPGSGRNGGSKEGGWINAVKNGGSFTWPGTGSRKHSDGLLPQRK